MCEGVGWLQFMSHMKGFMKTTWQYESYIYECVQLTCSSAMHFHFHISFEKIITLLLKSLSFKCVKVAGIQYYVTLHKPKKWKYGNYETSVMQCHTVNTIVGHNLFILSPAVLHCENIGHNMWHLVLQCRTVNTLVTTCYN